VSTKPAVSVKSRESLFRHRAFRLLFTTRAAANTANQMQAAAVGWMVYDMTGSALALGLIGLVQFVPPFCATLFAGQVVDHYNRRLILASCYVVEMSVSLGLLALAIFFDRSVHLVFALLLVNALARTFEGPTLQSLVANTVPRTLLIRAVSAHASAGKMSQLIGPILGGGLYGFGPGPAFGLCAFLIAVAVIASLLLPIEPTTAERPKVTWTALLAGLRFVWARPVLLGAMSLDLAATLFGGVTALLPIFARDIFDISSWGFGALRGAPAAGAVVVATILARLPVTRASGRIMLAAVAAYGCATIAFGLSDHWGLATALLFLIGAADMLSTVIRQSLIQFATPDGMRGRVFAINTLFVNCAGQLGTFESGVTAAWFGPVGSAVLGGAAVLGIVGYWAWRFPDLLRVERPEDVAHDRPFSVEGVDDLERRIR
jgi:MFS family permease